MKLKIGDHVLRKNPILRGSWTRGTILNIQKTGSNTVILIEDDKTHSIRWWHAEHVKRNVKR